jgi:F-type H+-transporting ATPase subunit delta
MTRSAIALRYANALAEVVTDPGSKLQPQALISELRAFESALQSSAELRSALETPAVSPGRKKAVVGRIADVLKLSRIPRNFLFVLVDHRRIAALAEIIQLFETVLDERLGFARAEVVSAVALGDAERLALTSTLEKVAGKRIRGHFSTDPELIGGIVARIGSTVYDGSVRGQLQALERRLATEG